MRTRKQIVDFASGYVGHREVKPNRSPLIDEWLRRCGLDPEKVYAWCAAFASACVEDRETDAGEIVIVACAGALRLGRMFEPTRTPQPGDLMFFPTDGKGAGHVGIVVAGDDLHVLCIEGNSDNRVRFVLRLRSEVFFANVRPDEELELPPLSRYPKAPLVRVSKAGTR